MRFSIVAAVAALSSTALAQGLLDQIPKCAQTCFGNNLGTCGPVDIGCVCGNKNVINSVSCCVFATCSQADTQTTIDFAVKLCKTANIDVNTHPDCPSGSASASASAAPATGSASASGSSKATGSSTATNSAVSASASAASASASASKSAAAAAGTSNAAPLPFQTAGAGFGLGMAVAGMVALL